MKILIDIGHPAHIHYFRNFISIMMSKGHEFLITSRDKEVTFELLSAYKLSYISRGKGRKNIIGKMIYLFQGVYTIYKASKKFNPDLFVSFGSPYAAQASSLIKKPHVVFDDTEHSKFEQLMYKPFSKSIITPEVFFKDMGVKQIRFNSYMELCYLHPKYFYPKQEIFKQLNININTKYVILRFISWDANHDIGEKGLSYEYKIKLINELNKKYRVFISSEGILPKYFIKFKLNIKPEYLHSVLFYAQLYIGEGSTTAAECSILGTPSIYVNSLFVSYCAELEEKYGLLYIFNKEKGVLEKARELLSMPNLKDEWHKRRMKMLSEKIDVTAFMVWFIENYPQSVKIMKENPAYQYRFK
ncbi:MAG: DUF354 domain-containing protein [Ignavibacteriaceae bacterium]